MNTLSAAGSQQDSKGGRQSPGERATSPQQDKVAEDAAGLPEDWQTVLISETQKPYFQSLTTFVSEERATCTIYPPANEVFTAFHYTPFARVKVLLLGQDPYPSPGHAHGLCFSVKPGVKHPPSLRNMFHELRDDLGCSTPNHGYLGSWAKQGILMLNTVLTVREGEANSHAGKGWEQFTDAVIESLSNRTDAVVFVFWGNQAQKKTKLINESIHTIIKMAHPSPLSAKKFKGSRPYSAINQALVNLGKAPIDWQLEDI